MFSFLKNKIVREIIGVFFIAFAVFSFISLISYHSDDPSFSKYISTKVPVKNYAGIVGAYFSDAIVQFIGSGSYFIIIAFLFIGWTIFRNEKISISIFSLIGGVSSTIFLCSLTYLLFSTDPFFGKVARSGGALGYFIAEELIWLFNRGGAYIVIITMLTFSIVLTTRISIGDTLTRLNGLIGILLKGLSAIKPKAVKKKEKRVKQPAQKIEPVHQTQNIDTEPPKIISPVRNEEEKEDFEIEDKFASYDTTGEYTLPSLSLLDSPSLTVKKRDEDELINNSSILEKKLIDFGIEGKVVQVLPGPVITMYEFEPASGVKVSRIMSLADDLALAMKAISVRILAPVPGKSVVGIEIPNVYRDSVSLKELLSSDEFKKAKSKLSLGLGMNISGKPVVTDLAQIPHLLVAGATGSGKSVGINSMICSILFNSTPDEVKMIMIDPKMIELSIYDGIPHLIAPVVTNPKKAANALRWVVEEMERRYNSLAEKGVRNIDGYNRTIEDTEGRRQKAEDRKQKSKNIKKEDTEDQELEEIVEEKEEKKLPYIVVIIDELADLMMVSSKDVEDALTRLAQMARAAGIHLLVATQRPSVDVLTGIIKANFPSRISYQVSSRIDSRTILDTIGAERLLGKGDMLFLPPGTSRLQRIHGAYVSEVEIKKVVEFLKKQQKPIYLESILKPKIDEIAEDEGEDSDELYDQAVALVSSTRQASISMIQRRLRIGYNRAARMIEIMEKHGLVGPADGAKPREVYVRDINDSGTVNT